MTALHWAALKGRTAIVTLLLDHKAPVTRGYDKTAPLHLGFTGHVDSVKVLLNKVLSVDRDAKGRTALMIAAKNGHLDVLEHY